MMKRRPFLFGLGAAALAPAAWFATRELRVEAREDSGAAPVIGRLQKSDEEWKALLSPAAYAVLFEEATERAGSSPLNAEKRPGTFVCAACYLPLFNASHKYESGTGWPSFFTHLPGVMGTKRDWALVLPRTEYHCARCGGHQGHVFDDGPEPTGQRWCNNGVALQFVPEGSALPELRA
jgi:peptide-methionine (R)-S-oxide reductase